MIKSTEFWFVPDKYITSSSNTEGKIKDRSEPILIRPMIIIPCICYLKDTAILRIEQVAPFPYDCLMDELGKYKNAQFIFV